MEKSLTKISLGEKLCYTCGNLGMMLISTMTTNYLLLFYTDIFGIIAGLAGTVFVVGKFVDAFANLAMGFISDRTKTKWGSYRPYFLFLAIPFAVVGWLMFRNPDISMTGKLIYAYGTYILYVLIYAGAYVPYGSMINVMTNDTDQRVTLSAFREVGSSTANFILGVLIVPMVTWLGHGNTNTAEGWSKAMIIFGIAAVAMFLATFFGTKERLPAAPEHIDVKESIAALKGNTPLLILCIMLLLTGAAGWFQFSWFSYYAKYVLNDLGAMSTMMAVFSVCSFLSQLCTQPIAKKLGKRNTMIAGNVSFVLSGIFYVAAGTNLLMVYIAMGLFGIGSGWVFCTFWGTVPDCVEWGEWKSGVRAPGFIYSVAGFVNKVSGGLGALIATATLTVIKFVPNVEQTAATVSGFRWSTGLYVAITSIIAIVLLIYYPLDKKTYDKITAELAERRAASAESAVQADV